MTKAQIEHPLRRAWALLGWILCAGLLSACPNDSSPGWALVNRRDHPLELWVRPALGCLGEVDLSDARNYGEERIMLVRAQDYIRLPSSGQSVPPYSPCGALWLHVEGEFEIVIAWAWEPYFSPHDNLSPYALLVEGPRENLRLTIPDALNELPPPAR
jgi:hypothetical protein